jgi:hypothetical protein
MLGRSRSALEIIRWPFLFLCWLEVHCGIYKSSNNIPNILYLNSSPPPLYFIPPNLHCLNSFNRYHFCMYTVILLYVHSYNLSQPGALLQTTCSTSVLQFCKRKKCPFYLFKIVTQEVPLCHFLIYKYYSSIWFTSSIFLICTLVPFLWWFHTV